MNVIAVAGTVLLGIAVWPDGRRQVTRYVAMYDGAEYPSETVLHESAEAQGLRRDDTVIFGRSTRERASATGNRGAEWFGFSAASCHRKGGSCGRKWFSSEKPGRKR